VTTNYQHGLIDCQYDLIYFMNLSSFLSSFFTMDAVKLDHKKFN